MDRFFRSCLGASALLIMSAPSFARKPSASPDKPDLKITVYLYNYAQVSATLLGRAKQEAARIYRAAGVETEWADCPRSVDEVPEYPGCQTPVGSTWIALRVLSRSMIGGLGLDPSKFGLAMLREDGGFGSLALVCSECAEPLVQGGRYPYGLILGGLMAHELGHLLLATTRHSAEGLMHSPWDRRDLEYAAHEQMLFTPKEAQQIRAQVRDRMRDRQATPGPKPGCQGEPVWAERAVGGLRAAS